MYYKILYNKHIYIHTICKIIKKKAFRAAFQFLEKTLCNLDALFRNIYVVYKLLKISTMKYKKES